MNALSPVAVETALVSSTALTPPASDAALLAACAQFDAAERTYLAVFDRPRRTTRQEDVAGEKACRIQAPLLHVIAANPPTTLAGAITVARSLELWDRELLKVEVGVDTTGEVLTTALVRGLLEQSAPAADAELLRLCTEFMEVHRDREDKAEGPNAIADDDTFEVVNNAAAERMASLVGRMEAVPPRTEAGVLAVLHCLAANDGEMHCSFDEPDTLNHGLLRLVLQGTTALVTPIAAAPCPDAGLLTLRPEFERLIGAVKWANECPAADVDDPVFGEFDEFCQRIATMPPAATGEGRALQAAAAMHQLSYVMSEGDAEEGSMSGGGAAWRVLAGIAGDRYPLPGRGVAQGDVEDPAVADAPLLDLKLQFDKLHEELQAALKKNPARGGKRATQRMFDQVIAQAVGMPKARTAAGVKFQQAAEYLMQVRGTLTSQARA